MEDELKAFRDWKEIEDKFFETDDEIEIFFKIKTKKKGILEQRAIILESFKEYLYDENKECIFLGFPKGIIDKINMDFRKKKVAVFDIKTKKLKHITLDRFALHDLNKIVNNEITEFI